VKKVNKIIPLLIVFLVFGVEVQLPPSTLVEGICNEFFVTGPTEAGSGQEFIVTTVVPIGTRGWIEVTAYNSGHREGLAFPPQTGSRIFKGTKKVIDYFLVPLGPGGFWIVVEAKLLDGLGGNVLCRNIFPIWIRQGQRPTDPSKAPQSATSNVALFIQEKF